MGTSFRTIVAPSASLEEAPALAERVIHHLIDQKIIRAQRSDCSLGEKGGYSPGENVEEALANWDPDAAQTLSGTSGVCGPTA